MTILFYGLAQVSTYLFKPDVPSNTHRRTPGIWRTPEKFFKDFILNPSYLLIPQSLKNILLIDLIPNFEFYTVSVLSKPKSSGFILNCRSNSCSGHYLQKFIVDRNWGLMPNEHCDSSVSCYKCIRTGKLVECDSPCTKAASSTRTSAPSSRLAVMFTAARCSDPLITLLWRH